VTALEAQLGGGPSKARAALVEDKENVKAQ
jgi:hypothetical protein